MPGMIFTKQSFVLGFPYRQKQNTKCKLISVIVGQEKTAVGLSKKNRMHQKQENKDMMNLLKSRISTKCAIDICGAVMMYPVMSLMTNSFLNSNQCLTGYLFSHIMSCEFVFDKRFCKIQKHSLSLSLPLSLSLSCVWGILMLHMFYWCKHVRK